MLKITRVTTVWARNNLGELISRAFYGREIFILTRRGKDLVAFVHPDLRTN